MAILATLKTFRELSAAACQFSSEATGVQCAQSAARFFVLLQVFFLRSLFKLLEAFSIFVFCNVIFFCLGYVLARTFLFQQLDIQLIRESPDQFSLQAVAAAHLRWEGEEAFHLEGSNSQTTDIDLGGLPACCVCTEAQRTHLLRGNSEVQQDRE